MFRAQPQVRRAPATLRVERLVRQQHGAVRLCSERRRERLGGLVVGRRRARERTQPAGQRTTARRPANVVDLQPIGRDRACLVQTDNIQIVERFDGGVVLHNRTQPRHAQRTHGKRDREAQHQTFRHHRRRRRNRRANRFIERAAGDQERNQNQQPENERGHDQAVENALEAQLERRFGAFQLPRFAGLPDGPRLAADARRAVVARPAHAERSRLQFLARTATHRVGLAGQDRLVQLRLFPHDRPIGDHLIARAENEQVICDDIRSRHIELIAFAHHSRRRRSQRHQLTQISRRANLLECPDQHVRDHHDPHERGILQMIRLLLRDREHEQDPDQPKENQVEVREDIGNDHIEVRALPRGVTVDAAVQHPLRDISLAQTQQLRRFGSTLRSRRAPDLIGRVSSQRRRRHKRRRRHHRQRSHRCGAAQLAARFVGPVREPAGLRPTFKLCQSSRHLPQRLGIERRLTFLERRQVKQRQRVGVIERRGSRHGSTLGPPANARLSSEAFGRRGRVVSR